MPEKKPLLDRFSELTRDDLEDWAGGQIVSRGKKYQEQDRVVDLAVMDDGSLLAWVKGSARYATMVAREEFGELDSVCTCPYGWNCKHAVAAVFEYLERLSSNRPVPSAEQNDERLRLLGEGLDPNGTETARSEEIKRDIDDFLQGQTKAQLIDLIHDLAGQNPEIEKDLADRKQLSSGKVQDLVARLRLEIHALASGPGWQNYWQGEGYTPDYSGIRRKLEALLGAGHTDEVLALGRELVTTGIRQVEESHDEGETAREIATCLPVIVAALDLSSLDAADKLTWALDALLEDDYGVYGALEEYLYQQHPQTAWGTLADQLLARLQGLKRPQRTDAFLYGYERDRLSDWVIHALERAGREEEIIPLCLAEAKRTGSYNRLVSRLIEDERYEEAENWIREGIQALGPKWPGLADGLREKMREIRTFKQDWPVVAALRVEEFVGRPGRQAFEECKKASDKIKVWPEVRALLLNYLENGELPWKQKDWPLPASGLAGFDRDRPDRFPLFNDLINIAILEKKPDQVLRWYDQRPQGGFGFFGPNEDAIATAVQTFAPERAVAIWKDQAERLIARVTPKAYQEAAKFLRKAGEVLSRQNQQEQWEQYLKSLRGTHARKRRLLEVLDGLEGKPLLKKKRR